MTNVAPTGLPGQKLTINMVTSPSTALLNGIPHVAGEATALAMLAHPSVMSLSAHSMVKRRKTSSKKTMSTSKIKQVVTDEAEQTSELRKEKLKSQLEKNLKRVTKQLAAFKSGDAISTPTLNHIQQLSDAQAVLQSKLKMLSELEETDASCVKYETKKEEPVADYVPTIVRKSPYPKKRFNEDDEEDMEDEEPPKKFTPGWVTDSMFKPPAQVKLIKRSAESLKTQDNLHLFKNVPVGENKILMGQPTDYDKYVELAMASGQMNPKVHIDQGICLNCYSTMFIGEADSSIVCYECGVRRRFDDMALPDMVPGGLAPTMTRSAGWKAHHVSVQGASGATSLISTNLPNSAKPVKSGPAARAAFAVTFELPARPLLADENGKPLLSAATSELHKQKLLAESEKKKPGRRKKQASSIVEDKKSDVQKRAMYSEKQKLFPFGDLDLGATPQSQQIFSSTMASSTGILTIYPQVESMIRFFRPRQHARVAPEIYDKIRLEAFKSRKTHFDEDDIKKAIRSIYQAPVTSKNPMRDMSEDQTDEYLLNVPYCKSDGLATMAIPMKLVQQLYEEFHSVALPTMDEQQATKVRTDFHDAVEAAKKLGCLSLLRAQFVFAQVCKRIGLEDIAKFHDAIRPGNVAYEGLMVCWKKICKLLGWDIV